MRRFLLFAALSVLLGVESHGQEQPAFAPEPATLDEPDKRPFASNPNGDGMSVDGFEDALRAGNTLTITFPTEMVPSDRIDA
ncbi:MAG TPA: hypothetical protein VIS71_10870, partial [Terrimicrobium sp.]